MYGRISLKVELVDGAKPMNRKYAEAGVHLICTTREIRHHRTGQHLKPVNMETRNSYCLFFLASTVQSLVSALFAVAIEKTTTYYPTV